jgi:hypothetical protein
MTAGGSGHAARQAEPSSWPRSGEKAVVWWAWMRAYISATMSGRKALKEFELRLGKLGATTEMVDGWWEVAESLLE